MVFLCRKTETVLSTRAMSSLLEFFLFFFAVCCLIWLCFLLFIVHQDWYESIKSFFGIGLSTCESCACISLYLTVIIHIFFVCWMKVFYPQCQLSCLNSCKAGLLHILFLIVFIKWPQLKCTCQCILLVKEILILVFASCWLQLPIFLP